METTASARTGRTRPAQQHHGDGRSGQRRPATDDSGRWLSLLGGGALAAFGLSRGSLGGLALAGLGGALAYRGATRGRNRAAGAVAVEDNVSILRTPEELYGYWRNLENLPHFMRNLQSVRVTGGSRSHWVALGPLNVRTEWDAELTEDRPNERIAWRSLPGSPVSTEGSVEFTQAPGNRGTRVKVVMRYTPPGGKVGDRVAALFGSSAEQEVREDLRRFKRLMETGEVPTTRGQSSGRGRDPWEQSASMIVQHRAARGLGWFSIGLGSALLAAPQTMSRLIGVRDREMLLRLVGAREVAAGFGILKQQHPTGWLWARVAGDAMDVAMLSGALCASGGGRDRTAAALAAVLGITALDVAASLQFSRSPRAE